MNAFVDIWLARLKKRGFVAKNKMDRSGVIEDGAKVAQHLLSMAIRAIDYCPPTDIDFSDYLSALLTIDREVVPDDSKYNYRDALLANFAKFDIAPARGTDPDGVWTPFTKPLQFSRVHFQSMLRDKEEVFRFIWENRETLKIDARGYVEVESVRPSTRVAPDGFILNETVAEYVEILTIRADELKMLNLAAPDGMPKDTRLRIFSGGALVFSEYGHLKYQISNSLKSHERQQARLNYLWRTGFFQQQQDAKSYFARLHFARATR
jgi:hypothetical protein